jgi:hypothetical protein
MLVQDFIPYPSETQYVGFIRPSHLAFFPKLVYQNQFNRPVRALCLLVVQFRRYWILRKGWIDRFSFCKGFFGFNWQTQIFDETNNLIWTPQCSNQHYINANYLHRWLTGLRETIEGFFRAVQNTGRHIRRLLSKNVLGLCTRLIMKMTRNLLRHLLLVDFIVNVEIFEALPAF